MKGYSPTSLLHRKLKAKLSGFSTKIQSSKVYGSLQDLTVISKRNNKEQVTKYKCSNSDTEDYDEDNKAIESGLGTYR